MRQINYLAKSSLLGSILGLIITIPIYYKWGIDGIVPGIIATSCALLFFTWFYARKVKIEKIKVSPKETITEGKDMLTMGFMLSLSGLYVLAKSMGIKAFISHLDGIEAVGLYTAGFAIVTGYVGMVFTAMSTDYYPKLSAVAHNNQEAKKLINQQAEIAILILAPIIAVFIIFIGWIIPLLYSDQFVTINLMIQWAALGMFFKAISWSVAFIFLAKGKSKLYLANELIGGTVTLVCHLLGYYLGGLTGMGIGFMIGYFYYMIQVFFVAKKYFEFNFEKELLKILLIQLVLSVIAFLMILFLPKPLAYIIGSLVIIVSTIYSIKELDNRIGIKQVLEMLFKKNK
jgi:O-antigen/teichoic acid export membrane protein